MKIFFAGVEKNQFRDLVKEEGGENILVSFFYLQPSELKKIKEEGFKNVFIDSGGYSARKGGKEVDITQYRDFLTNNKDLIFTAANLDVMDVDKALKNQKYLEGQYPVLPVYHYSEYVEGDRALLEKFCKEYDYIALGGMAGVLTDKISMINYLRFCFKTIMRYKVKVHGFGITSSDILKEYPFYTVDSTTWLTGGQFGIICKWEADKFTMKSTLHPSMKDEMIDRNIPIEMFDNYKQRLRNNVREFLKMEEAVTRLWKLRGIIYD